MKLFDMDGSEIGKEYYVTLNSAWDGQVFEFENGEKTVFARKYGGMGFDRVWEATPRGMERYEAWRRQRRLVEEVA